MASFAKLIGASPLAGLAAKATLHRPAAKSSLVCNAKAGSWLPGSETPAYLDNLPGSYGFVSRLSV
jgi:hypothetical protein